MEPNRESKTAKEDIPVELPGCIAYPTGEGCPVEWCRKARGDWCKARGDWCKDKHGNLCKWKRI